MNEPNKILVCTDCMLMAANGEADPDLDFEMWQSAVNKLWPPDKYGWLSIGGEDEDYGFSWSSCDYCGSNLGGDRFTGYVFGKES